MKKLNSLASPFLGLDGQPILNQVGTNPDGTPIFSGPEITGKMLANVLARGQAEAKDAVRAWMIAQQIYSAADSEDGSLSLEEADFSLVQEAVDRDPKLSNMGRAVLLTALNGAKDGKEKA